MPIWGSARTYKELQEIRRCEEKKLIAKGLLRGSNKFEKIMLSKMAKYR